MELDLSKINCKCIFYCGQEGESIKNHILPNSLRNLWCSNNELTSLPNLPNSLIDLYCHINKLTSLPNLPDSLKKLYCWKNQLASLPKLPNSLQNLNCYNNKLTLLPNLPNSLQRLFCNNNSLKSFPILPTSLNYLELGYLILEKIEYNPDYKNMNFKFINTKITIGDYIIKTREDYISYMEDYEKYLLSKVKSARN